MIKFLALCFCLISASTHTQPASYLPLDQNAPLTYTVGLGNRNEPFEGAVSVSYSHEPRRPELQLDFKKINQKTHTIIIENNLNAPASIAWTNVPEQNADGKRYGIIGAAVTPYGTTKISVPEFYFFEKVAIGGLGKQPVRLEPVLKHSFPGILTVEIGKEKASIQVSSKSMSKFLIQRSETGALEIVEIKKENLLETT